jgi:hypothetical protein
MDPTPQPVLRFSVRPPPSLAYPNMSINSSAPASRLVLAAAMTFLSILAACDSNRSAADSLPPGDGAAPEIQADPTQPEESVSQPIGPTVDLPPNEVGEIMVLEYHRLGEPEGEWYRSVDNFRNDLHRLYEAGYRPITMRQMVEGDIDVPRGTSPVVFTIDDSSTGQFYLLEDGRIDPNSMVGIWDAFQRENPGWEHGATWCVLPAADHPSNFFGERPSREVPRAEREERIQRKVDYLVENGHEICNHTLYHARLDRARDDAQAQEWIGRGEDSIQVYLPEGYEIVTHALPLGMWPQNRSLAWRGTHAGRAYEYKAVLEVTGGPNESPFDRNFDPRSVKRLIVAPNALERQLATYDRNPQRRYVSDGNPRTITVPADLADRVDRERWPGREVRIVDEGRREDAPSD